MNEPTSVNYSIRMETPIGIRFGKMTVLCNSETVSGRLDILQHIEPFEGKIDTHGNCEITGKIVTLMRTIKYVARGNISPDSLSLSLADGRHILKITGTACRP